MTASVNFVSPDWLRRTQTGNEQTRTQPRFFQSEKLTSNSFRSLDYACRNESIMYVLHSPMQAN